MIHILNRIIRSRVRIKSFPKLNKSKFNNLWELTIKRITKMNIIDILRILNKLILNYTTMSLLAIPTIILIIKDSGIFSGVFKESDDDTKNQQIILKAFNEDSVNLEYFLTVSIIFSIIKKILKVISTIFWFPLKIALIFFILKFFNYDVTYFYFKLNNLSLGILDWYYRTFIDLIDSLLMNNDFYNLNNNNANIKKP